MKIIELTASTLERVCGRMHALLQAAANRRGLQTLKLHDYGGYAIASPWTQLPELSPKDVQLVNRLRLELTESLGTDAISDSDVLFLALQELYSALTSDRREDKVLRFQFQLWDAKRKEMIQHQM